eukprot:gene10687-3308_t
MKLIALTICLLFLTAFGKYSSVFISKQRDCTESNTGFTVPDSQCFFNSNTKLYSKHSCDSKNLDHSLKYTCNAKPVIESTGFFKEIHTSRNCQDSKPFTEFVTKQYCENVSNSRGKSMSVYFDRNTNWITKEHYSQEKCAGERTGASGNTDQTYACTCLMVTSNIK